MRTPPPMEPLEGGITRVPGFRAAGVAAGIRRPGRRDLALVVTEPPAVAAGTFTHNRFQAAPLRVTRARIRRSPIQAIIMNSGNANACTGPQGLEDAREMCRLVARALGIPPGRVCVASTGVIGTPLPMERIRKAIPQLVAALDEKGGRAAAEAILTTDTRPKEAAHRAWIGGRWITVGGMAKGAGMIAPRMATMLAFLGTDAGLPRPRLQALLREVVEETFNRITVDGDISTNDMVLLLANGRAGALQSSQEEAAVRRLLYQVAQDLSYQIVSDGEGATRRIRIEIREARTRAEALRAARAVAESLLVKTMLSGEDPNWGRLLAAVGAARVAFREQGVRIFFEEVQVVDRAQGLGTEAEARAARIMGRSEYTIRIHLGAGAASAAFWTTDLTAEYVRINMGYRT